MANERELQEVREQLEKAKLLLQQYQRRVGELNSIQNIKENLVVVVKKGEA